MSEPSNAELFAQVAEEMFDRLDTSGPTDPDDTPAEMTADDLMAAIQRDNN